MGGKFGDVPECFWRFGYVVGGSVVIWDILGRPGMIRVTGDAE